MAISPVVPAFNWLFDTLDIPCKVKALLKDKCHSAMRARAKKERETRIRTRKVAAEIIACVWVQPPSSYSKVRVLWRMRLNYSRRNVGPATQPVIHVFTYVSNSRLQAFSSEFSDCNILWFEPETPFVFIHFHDATNPSCTLVLIKLSQLPPHRVACGLHRHQASFSVGNHRPPVRIMFQRKHHVRVAHPEKHTHCQRNQRRNNANNVEFLHAFLDLFFSSSPSLFFSLISFNICIIGVPFFHNFSNS